MSVRTKGIPGHRGAKRSKSGSRASQRTVDKMHSSVTSVYLKLAERSQARPKPKVVRYRMINPRYEKQEVWTPDGKQQSMVLVGHDGVVQVPADNSNKSAAKSHMMDPVETKKQAIKIMVTTGVKVFVEHQVPLPIEFLTRSLLRSQWQTLVENRGISDILSMPKEVWRVTCLVYSTFLAQSLEMMETVSLNEMMISHKEGEEEDEHLDDLSEELRRFGNTISSRDKAFIGLEEWVSLLETFGEMRPNIREEAIRLVRGESDNTSNLRKARQGNNIFSASEPLQDWEEELLWEVYGPETPLT